jgi:hypothetical protein
MYCLRANDAVMFDYLADEMARIFRTAYSVAKEELALEKFQELCLLQKLNGIQLPSHYANSNRCLDFLHAIANTLITTVVKEVLESPFFSIIIDGSTNRATREIEMMYIRYVFKIH